ncbi:MotA/TolQ/ExbB proton channel family protein [bacterium]|nr:MotA/TolQ/ExbB proton channel family protein [bacterium]
MDLTPILDFVGNAVYVLQAITAVQGIFLWILVLRRIQLKRFGSQAAADAFMGEVREHLAARRFDDVAQLCDSPNYWAKATPQLILIALAHRDRPMAKLRALLAERFSSEVIADLEYRVAWINTIIKTAPMLGLQGTVLGMISAFAKIASRQKSGINPADLASDISFALWTTAIGLLIAIPLVMAVSAIQVRLSKLQDSVQRQLGEFLEMLEAALSDGRRRG